MRKPGWPEALAAYIRKREDAPFEWGRQDCCAFAAGAVIAMTGDDPMADLRGYKDAEGAARLMTRPLEAFLDERFRRIGKGLALRGDLAIAPAEGGRLAVCVVEGEHLVAPGRDGLIRLPRALALAAWRVA